MRKVKRDVVVDKAKMDEILLSDSTIHWSERNGRRVPVTCGKCGEKRVINLPRGKKRLSLTGFCSKCRNGRAGDEKHSSGTIIHWGERDPENKQKVRITCHHCKSRERFVWTTSARDPNWRGQCDDCNHQRGRPKKFFKEEKLPNGSIFHWTERDPDNFRRVPVTCGKCAEKRVVLIGTRWRGTGLCHKCASPKTFHNDQQVRNTGSIIHWREVDPADPKRVMVTCGICGIKRSHSKNALLANYKKSKWTGYCRNRYECSQAS